MNIHVNDASFARILLHEQAYLVVNSMYFEGQTKHDRYDVFELSELILQNTKNHQMNKS